MKFYSLLFQLSKISDIFRSLGGSAKTSLSETTGESGMISALMSDPKKLFSVLAIYAAAAIIGYLAGGYSRRAYHFGVASFRLYRDGNYGDYGFFPRLQHSLEKERSCRDSYRYAFALYNLPSQEES